MLFGEDNFWWSVLWNCKERKTLKRGVLSGGMLTSRKERERPLSNIKSQWRSAGIDVGEGCEAIESPSAASALAKCLNNLKTSVCETSAVSS